MFKYYLSQSHGHPKEFQNEGPDNVLEYLSSGQGKEKTNTLTRKICLFTFKNEVKGTNIWPSG